MTSTDSIHTPKKMLKKSMNEGTGNDDAGKDGWRWWRQQVEETQNLIRIRAETMILRPNDDDDDVMAQNGTRMNGGLWKLNELKRV